MNCYYFLTRACNKANKVDKFQYLFNHEIWRNWYYFYVVSLEIFFLYIFIINYMLRYF